MSKADKKLRDELAAAGHTTAAADASSGDSTEPTTSAGTTDAKRGPKTRIPPGSKPSAILRAHIADEPALFEAARLNKEDKPDGDTFKTTAGIIDNLAKKVGEKAVNLLRFRSQPDQVQVYTRMGLNQLVTQGEVTSKGFVDLFSAKYKPGTARAQGSQLMQLFPALGVATKDGSTLKLNRSSVIVQAFRKASPSA